MSFDDMQEEEISIPKIREKLIEASDLYYNDSASNISDEEFDNLRDLLLKLSPNDPFFKMVGSPVKTSEWKKEKLRLPNFLKDLFRAKQIEEEGNDPKVTGRTFGTPHDIASMQVASKFDATDKPSLEKLYSKDEREHNEGQPFKYKSFETVKDQDMGRDPTGRRDVDKAVNGSSKESYIKRLNNTFASKQTAKSLLKESVDIDAPNMLNENNLLED